MRAVLWPLCSQQDKRSGEFLLDSCGACKQLAFIADKLMEFGWHVTAVLPKQPSTMHPFKCWVERVWCPSSNLHQRVHWDTRDMMRICSGADLCICNHEFLSFPLRQLFPKLRLVQMLTVQPEPLSLFMPAWEAADLVACQGGYAAGVLRRWTKTPVSAWKLAYDERDFQRESAVRDIDVVFQQRCSSTNYTHHEEFIAALPLLKGLRVVFTDVTCYLRKQRQDLEFAQRNQFLDVLHRSKVAVALNDNLYGGLSIREAVRAGCKPVVLNALCYKELVGDGWLATCRAEPDSIAAAVRVALESDASVPVQNCLRESYQEGWKQVEHDLLA